MQLKTIILRFSHILVLVHETLPGNVWLCVDLVQPSDIIHL
jgi:hypothetical protein